LRQGKNLTATCAKQIQAIRQFEAPMVCPKRLCIGCSALDGGGAAAHAKGRKL
jgi:hypothetical protein